MVVGTWNLQYGETVLIQASWSGQIDFVRFFLEIGADKEVKNMVREHHPASEIIMILSALCFDRAIKQFKNCEKVLTQSFQFEKISEPIFIRF
jgi:hypothetical protein